MTTKRARLMKSVTQFIKDWQWKKYQESPAFWYQCVALDKLFYEKVIWYRLPPFGWSAKTAWTAFPFPKEFQKVYNSLFGRPQVGDILFWDRWQHGHTAICVRSTLFNVQYIEQNGWTWTGTWMWTDAIRLVTTSYKGIVGWAKFTSLDV